MDKLTIKSFTIEHYPKLVNGKWMGTYRMIDCDSEREFFVVSFKGNTPYEVYREEPHVLSCDDWCLSMVKFLAAYCLNWFNHKGNSPIYSFERAILPEYVRSYRNKSIEEILQ